MLNIALLEKVKAKILEEPDQFVMSTYFSDNRFFADSPEVIPNCGTAACIAGWALAIDAEENPKEANTRIQKLMFSSPSVDYGTLAIRLLGLPNREMFVVDAWPLNYRYDWYNAVNDKNKKKQVEIAVKVIDYYIKLYGDEND